MTSRTSEEALAEGMGLPAPYDYSVDLIKQALDAAGLSLVPKDQIVTEDALKAALDARVAELLIGAKEKPAKD